MRTVQDFLDSVKARGVVCFDVEHDSKASYYDKDFLEAFTGVAFGTASGAFFSTDPDLFVPLVRHLLGLDVELCGSNIKYDLKCMSRFTGVVDTTNIRAKLCDTAVAANLLDDNLSPKEIGLKPLVKRIFGYEMGTFDKKLSQHSMEFYDYACDDAEYSCKLWEWQKPRIEAEGLMKFYRNILMEASLLFCDMELFGVTWDVPQARKIINRIQGTVNSLENEIKQTLGEINLNSTQQLTQRLFQDLGYSVQGVKRTPKGALSLDAESMDFLAKKYPVCANMAAYRTGGKMISTYLEPTTEKTLSAFDNKVHASFALASATGRTRCSRPNLQNFPTYLSEPYEDIKIREPIIPRPGWKMLVADQSQLELRICAHVTGEPLFVKSFATWICGKCQSTGKSNILQHVCPNCGNGEDEGITRKGEKFSPFGFWHGEDLHQQTADNIKVIRGNRSKGKTLNFAFIYGSSAWTQWKLNPDTPLDEWERAREGFMRLYRYIPAWHEESRRNMLANPVIQDIYGRKRRILPNVVKKNEKHALNMYVNFQVQSSATSLMLHILRDLRRKWITEGGWGKTIIQSNFVHDEGVWECPPDMVDKYSADIVYAMENTVRLRVPLRAEVNVVDNWAQAK